MGAKFLCEAGPTDFAVVGELAFGGGDVEGLEGGAGGFVVGASGPVGAVTVVCARFGVVEPDRGLLQEAHAIGEGGAPGKGAERLHQIAPSEGQGTVLGVEPAQQDDGCVVPDLSGEGVVAVDGKAGLDVVGHEGAAQNLAGFGGPLCAVHWRSGVSGVGGVVGVCPHRGVGNEGTRQAQRDLDPLCRRRRLLQEAPEGRDQAGAVAKGGAGFHQAAANVDVFTLAEGDFTEVGGEGGVADAFFGGGRKAGVGPAAGLTKETGVDVGTFDGDGPAQIAGGDELAPEGPGGGGKGWVEGEGGTAVGDGAVDVALEGGAGVGAGLIEAGLLLAFAAGNEGVEVGDGLGAVPEGTVQFHQHTNGGAVVVTGGHQCRPGEVVGDHGEGRSAQNTRQESTGFGGVASGVGGIVCAEGVGGGEAGANGETTAALMAGEVQDGVKGALLEGTTADGPEADATGVVETIETAGNAGGAQEEVHPLRAGPEGAGAAKTLIGEAVVVTQLEEQALEALAVVGVVRSEVHHLGEGVGSGAAIFALLFFEVGDAQPKGGEDGVLGVGVAGLAHQGVQEVDGAVDAAVANVQVHQAALDPLTDGAVEVKAEEELPGPAFGGDPEFAGRVSHLLDKIADHVVVVGGRSVAGG